MRKQPAGSCADSGEGEIDLTPMLDVVFIMLIFFVVTASFVNDAGIAANRSDDSTVSGPQSQAILVEILAGDEIRINGRIVDMRAVRPNLEQLHAVDPDIPMVVHLAQASSTQALVSVLDAAELAQIEHVSVAPLQHNGTR